MSKETEILSLLKTMNEQMIHIDDRLSGVENQLLGFDKTLETLDRISIISDNRLSKVEKTIAQLPSVAHMVSEIHNRMLAKPDVLVSGK